ncbi:MAG: GNAT family N-acetyltransferase [Pseudomonadota bacterium]
MFPLGNLVAHGFGGDHPHGMTFWADERPPRAAILGLSNSGGVMPFWTDQAYVKAAADVLRGGSISGFAGPTSMVRPLMAALDLLGHAASLDADEPQFLLDLEDLHLPEGPSTLASISVDRETAISWRHAYNNELHLPTDDQSAAAASVDRWIAADSHRFLMIDGRPAAMTGFNAQLPDIVQIGGVYTPLETRGRGLARRAVALHLDEAREGGARQATLFAASDAAVACYTPLGFQRIGEFALVFFDDEVAL